MSRSQLSQAVTCRWSGGCLARTKDPSGLCHNHRRFSGSVVTPTEQGLVSTPPRISTTEKMRSSQPEQMQEMLENAHQAMNTRPRVYLVRGEPTLTVYPYYGDTIQWKGVTRPIPFRDDEMKVTVDVNPNNNLLSIDCSENQNALGAAVMEAETVANYQYGQHHSNAYHLYQSHSLEEYDDEAEVLAQLDLGDVADGKLVVMDPGSEYIKEKVEFRPNNPHMPSLSAYLEPKHYQIMEGNVVAHHYRVNGVQVEDDAQMDTAQVKILMDLERARNVISQNSFTDTGTGRLYLPIGWSDRDPIGPNR